MFIKRRGNDFILFKLLLSILSEWTSVLISYPPSGSEYLDQNQTSVWFGCFCFLVCWGFFVVVFVFFVVFFVCLGFFVCLFEFFFVFFEIIFLN